jgi:hypothetical protein
MIGSTSALFNGETKNAGSGFAGGWVDPPTAATANALGYDTSLAWTVGTHGPVTGQKLYGVDNGTSSNCTGAAYSLIATLPSASTAAYTDTNRATLATDGDWFCYQLVSTSGTIWTAPLALPATQIGLVTSAVAITNGNGTIAAGDTITLTFNQKTNLAAGNLKVCVFSATGAILVGDLKNGVSCGTAAADGYSVAQLTTAATISADTRFSTSTAVVSAVAPWTMTITLGAGTSVTTGASPTWTLTPAATILSNAVTDQATMCTTATSTCQPTTTTNF